MTADSKALTEEELQQVSRLLVHGGEKVVGPLRASLLTGGRSNLTYLLADGASAWALRRPPSGGVIESAHDVVREYRVMASLADTAVPVPRPVACDADGVTLGAPAVVVEFVPGVTARSQNDVASWSHDDFTDCANGMLGALVALHDLDPTAAGLGNLGRPGGYAERQLRRWSGQWERMEASDSRADRLLAALSDRVPEQRRCSVVHGDYRVDNVILDAADPGRVQAIVDWELSTLGDPVADVALMCAYRHPALDGVLGIRAAWTSDGFPDAAELRDGYESLSRQKLPDFGFHRALAFYKLAVIAQGIAYRHRLGVTAGEGYDGVAATVPQLLEAGLETVGTTG